MSHRVVPTLAVTAILAAVLAGCDGEDGGAPAGALSFSGGSTFTVGENGAVVVPVVVRRIGGSFGAVSVVVTPTGISATGGVPPLAPPTDFDASAIVVSFADGDVADKAIVVPILDDTTQEADETLQLTLSSPGGGAVLGALTTTTLTILNDDFAGSLEFAAAAFAYGENGSATTAVVVRRVGGSAGAVTASVMAFDGTANSQPASSIEPVDYAPFATTVSFADGDAVDKVVAFGGIVQDALPEIDETIDLALTSPTGGAALGAQTAAVLTILDDDATLTLLPSSNITNSKFGASVCSVMGRIAVGRPATTNNGGTVVVVDATSGATINVLTSPPTITIASFGASVTPAGDNVLIGAPETPINNTGAAFAYDPISGALRFSTSLFPASSFGAPVVFGDGRYFVAAPMFNGGGRVYAYDELSGLQSGFFQGGSVFGLGLIHFDGSLYVGESSGSGFVFGYDSATVQAPFLVIPNPFPSATPERFGHSIAATTDLLFVGAPDDVSGGSNAGRVYVFTRATGAFVSMIDAPSPPVASGKFGERVAIVRDRLVVQQKSAGASTSGRVLVYDAAFNLVQTIVHPSPSGLADFGGALAEFDGQLLVGAPLTDVAGVVDSGVAYVVKVN